MSKTLYVSDMDGTLLNSSSVLSPFTISLLNELIVNYGALFTVATARTPATVVNLMKDVKASLPFIVMAGEALWNNGKACYESARILDESVVSQLLAVFHDFDIHPFVYRKHDNHIMVYHHPALTAAEHAFVDPRVTTPLKQLTLNNNLHGEEQEDVMLIFAMGTFKRLRLLSDEITSRGIPCFYNCYHDIFNEELGFLDIYKENTTKAAAVKHLTRQLQVDRVVAFGDNLNDLPMMREADLSVAVSNAFEEVKQQADLVIGCNDTDAVPRWIAQDMGLDVNQLLRK